MAQVGVGVGVGVGTEVVFLLGHSYLSARVFSSSGLECWSVLGLLAAPDVQSSVVALLLLFYVARDSRNVGSICRCLDSTTIELVSRMSFLVLPCMFALYLILPDYVRTWNLALYIENA